MQTVSVTSRQVKEAFALAESMKAGPFDSIEEYCRRLTEERHRLVSLSEPDLNNEVHSQDRREMIDRAKWVQMVIPLDQCSVWRHMGKRPWATGPVSRVAALYPEKEKPGDRSWKMIELAKQGFYRELPIIVYTRESNIKQYRIDDGCHRALASYLSGARVVLAFVGTPGHGKKIHWKWEGED